MNELNKRPLCEDGRACEGKAEAFKICDFMRVDGVRITKAICGKCFLQAEKEEKELRLKEAAEKMLKDKGII